VRRIPECSESDCHNALLYNLLYLPRRLRCQRRGALGHAFWFRKIDNPTLGQLADSSNHHVGQGGARPGKEIVCRGALRRDSV
jgi:hypothetical protein